MTELADRVRISLYTAGMARAGWVGEWDDLDVTARARGAGSATWTCAADIAAGSALVTEGTRAVVEVRPALGVAWRQMYSGPLRTDATGPSRSARIACEVVDDWSVWNVTAWPVPGSGIGSQSSVAWTSTGARETILCALASATVSRLGLGVTVPSSLGRGGSITARVRFDRVGDVLLDLAERGGLTARVRQGASGRVLELGVGTDRTAIVLSEGSAKVASWRWQVTPPTLTRVVVGGAGVDAARTLVAVVDSAAEAAWGASGHPYIREGFVDGPNTTNTSELTAAGQAALDAAGARLEGLKVDLAESAGFRYGVHVAEGDTVQVELIPGVTRTATVAEVRVTASRSDGLKITPVLGDPTVGLPERVQAQIIAALARGVGRLKAR